MANFKKDIAIFTTFYSPHMGGVEVYSANLAKALISLGCSVTIVTSALNNDCGFREEDGIRILRLPSKIMLDNRYALLKKNKKYNQLMNELVNSKIDYVLVQQRFYPLCLEGMSFSQKNNLPLAVLDHGSAHLAISNPLIDPIISLYEHAITEKGKQYKPAYFGVSEKSAQWLEHFGINAKGVLHNAVDAASFAHQASKREFIKELDIQSDEMLIVFAGRLLKEKGVVKAAEAVTQLFSEGQKKIHLAIAGDGPLKHNLANFVSDCIHYVGKLNSSDLASLFQEADVFILPTDYPEGFPTVLLEAASQDTAIIVSDTAGARELIPSEEFGIVLKENTIDAIKDAITKYYFDKDYRDRVSSNIKRRTHELFNWQITAENLLNYFEEIDEKRST